MNISKHITYSEAIKSQVAIRKRIDNTPDNIQLEAMRLLAENVFEPVREYFDTPIAVTSFFRSEKLNKAIGGSKTSQHCKGEAMDIDADVFGKITNSQVFYFIMNNLDFDQLIYEYGNDDQPAWVHVSYKKEGNRKEILRAMKDSKGKTYYKTFDK